MFATDMSPTGDLLVTTIFLRGGFALGLAQGSSSVTLALHKASCCTPKWVTIELTACVDKNWRGPISAKHERRLVAELVCALGRSRKHPSFGHVSRDGSERIS